MSTNYFFRFDTRKAMKEAIDRWDFETVQDLFEENEIHIGKRSAGWVPLFESHPGKFTSVKEMKEFYENNKVAIFEECERELTWEQLYEQLICWNKDNEAASHLDVKRATWFRNDQYFYKDPEGYEFSKREFC